MKERSDEIKTFVFYFVAALGIVSLLNFFVFPLFIKQKATQVNYDTFLQYIENGTIKTVDIDDNKIGFAAVNKEGIENIYVTEKVDDPELLNRLYNAKVESFKEVIPKENSVFINALLTWILPLLILLGIVIKTTGRSQHEKVGLEKTISIGKNTKVYSETQTSKSFTDVAGQDEAKEAMQEIVDFLHNPHKYNEVGARIPKGALLIGPPGTGKSLLAQTVAGEADVPFFTISGSEFVEMYVGLGASRVRDLFKQAKEKAPCIIFIDEIDAIGKSRNSGAIAGNDEREQTLNQLLIEMDGFDADKAVVILAATNRPETLDKALLRPGRFDRRIPLELPDISGREAILKVHAQKIKMSNNVNLKAIARATSGASGADLANIINEAALRAVRMERKQIIQSDLEESVEVVIAGYQRKNIVLSVKDKETIACHEMGHAIVAAKQNTSSLVRKITIIPRTSGSLGYTIQVDETEQVLLSKEKALSKITTFMGGRAAEEIIFNTATSGAANDIEQATKIARSMVTRFGMSEEFDMMALETVNNPYLGGDTSLLVSAETASKIDAEVLKIIKSCHAKATSILRQNIDKLYELAKYLVEKETISGEEFMQMLSK